MQRNGTKTPGRWGQAADQQKGQVAAAAIEPLEALAAFPMRGLTRPEKQTRQAHQAVLLRGAYSPEHAAAYLDISRAALYRLMASGALRGYRQGRLRRFLRSELDAFLAAQSAEGDDGSGWDDAAS